MNHLLPDNSSGNAIPESTLRRMPVYLHYLRQLPQGQVQMISSATIATDLSLNPVQVRKDLAMTAANGRPKTGYVTTELISAIEQFLGYHKHDEVLLAGVGNLGRTLLSYDGFEKCGMRIVVAFDSDPAKIGNSIDGTEVLDIAKLENLAPRLGIKIGIITTPANQAQQVSDAMVRGGLIGIWNFSACRLQVPENVVVQNENITASFVVLSSKVNNIRA